MDREKDGTILQLSRMGIYIVESLRLFGFLAGGYVVTVGTPLAFKGAILVSTNLDLLPNDPFNRFVRNYIRAKTSSSKRNIILTGLSRLDQLALESHMDFLFHAAEEWHTA